MHGRLRQAYSSRERASHTSHDGAPVGHVRWGGQAPFLVVGSVPANGLAVLLGRTSAAEDHRTCNSLSLLALFLILGHTVAAHIFCRVCSEGMIDKQVAGGKSPRAVYGSRKYLHFRTRLAAWGILSRALDGRGSYTGPKPLTHETMPHLHICGNEVPLHISRRHSGILRTASKSLRD